MKIVKLILSFCVVILVALSLGVLFTYWRSINQVLPIAGETTEVVVSKGDGPRAVAQHLVDAGLIKSDRVFLVHVLVRGLRNNFYPGTYQLQRGETLGQIMTKLTSGKEEQFSVTIKEGFSIKDIAKEVAKKTHITEADFLAAAPVSDNEGYLFPDTYFLTPTTTAAQAVKIMRDNFDRRTKGFTPTYDQLILASIVEREAQKSEDRPVIAGVYQNRLDAGKALEADPTVQYAKGSWNPITLADYHSVNSPYNTYEHTGLPPTPISNPGLASIKAAMSPAEHNYFYFLTDGSGMTHYAKTFEEHTQNKQKFLYK